MDSVEKLQYLNPTKKETLMALNTIKEWIEGKREIEFNLRMAHILLSEYLEWYEIIFGIQKEYEKRKKEHGKII